jgi:large subunit ribosomal protein L10
MSIDQARKKEIIQELHQKIVDSGAVLLADHTGLNVKDITVLRKKLRDISVEYRVIKNTLARLAVRDSGKEQLEEYLYGPNSLVFLGEDVVEGTKIIADFIREHEKPTIKIGLVEDRLYDQKELARIAKLPPREVLLSSVARGMIAPVNSFAFLATEMIRRFIRAVDAVRASREGSDD